MVYNCVFVLCQGGHKNNYFSMLCILQFWRYKAYDTLETQ